MPDSKSGIVVLSPQLDTVGQLHPQASIAEIAAEPRLVGIHLDEAVELGGPLTRRVLDAFDPGECPEGLFPIVDTRCQRLMPGMYSAIPGWHCDDWPRPTYSSQPDPNLVCAGAHHFTASIDTLGGSLNPTEFAIRTLEARIDEDQPFWRQVHDAVEAHDRPTMLQPPGSVFRFSSHSLHRATPATARGWRYWFRLSFMHRAPEKRLTVGPEQVYVLSERNGW